MAWFYTYTKDTEDRDAGPFDDESEGQRCMDFHIDGDPDANPRNLREEQPGYQMMQNANV